MRSVFARLHPAVPFTSFALVRAFTMWFRHPFCLAASLIGAAAWAVYLRPEQGARFALTGLLPLFLFMWVLNPLFSHAGATILAYFPSGNPLTLESILFGLSAGAMLCAALCWFYCYHATMSSDKFICLFGRVIPALSLFLSMVLRFAPRFRARLRAVSAAQRGAGQSAGGGSLLRRVRSGGRRLSIMVTWSLESAVETADSMRSRGYGLPGRTAYQLYTFGERERDLMALILGLGFFVASLAARGDLAFRYYPAVKGAEWSLWQGAAMLAYLALCLLPLILDVKEDWAWKHSGRRA